MPYRVNVVQGHFAGDLLAEVLEPKPGELLVHDDLLSCGPMTPCSSLEEWNLRAAYWDSVAASRTVRKSDRDRDILANSARLRDADSILLWLGVGSAEQLLLAWMVQLLARIDVDIAKRTSVIQFTRVGDRDQDCWGVGPLNADQLRAHPAPELLPPDAVSELDRCWASITSSDPAALLTLLAEESPRVPHLRPALRPLVDRYPDHRTGLGRWDAELLPHPLVTLSGDPTAIRACEVALTDADAAVLAGDANAVVLNGIDDWVLGVRLDSTERRVWYRKGDALVRAS